MTRFVTLKFELREYAEDGETVTKLVEFENYGDLYKAQWRAGLLNPAELAGMQKIVEGLREIVGDSE